MAKSLIDLISYIDEEHQAGISIVGIDIWMGHQRDLVAAGVIAKLFANVHDGEYFSNIRGEWPARGLQLTIGNSGARFIVQLADEAKPGECKYVFLRVTGRKRLAKGWEWNESHRLGLLARDVMNSGEALFELIEDAVQSWLNSQKL